MMRDAALLLRRGLGGSNVQASVDLHGVRAEDLSGKLLGELERKLGLAAGGGACDHNPGPDGFSAHRPLSGIEVLGIVPQPSLRFCLLGIVPQPSLRFRDSFG